MDEELVEDSVGRGPVFVGSFGENALLKQAFQFEVEKIVLLSEKIVRALKGSVERDVNDFDIFDFGLLSPDGSGDFDPGAKTLEMRF
jgi:hypothetical protein